MADMDLLGPLAIVVSLIFGMVLEGFKSYRRNKRILRHKQYIAQRGI